VVLGRGGAGKSVLAIRFLLNWLSRRAPHEAVPVIFNLASWNPRATSLDVWLSRQLIRDHPALEAAGTGKDSTLAEDLITANLVLPVLDGFDEIAPGLQPAALRQLSASRHRFLMTSRTTEYASAVTASDVLTGAACVELQDLSLADTKAYLARAASRADWDRVFEALADKSASQLPTVLTTPLMIGLARVVYGDNPGQSPMELLDPQRFPDAGSIEDHLFAAFIPAVYDNDYNPSHRSRRRWAVRDVEFWHQQLARHMRALDTRDFAWWHVGDTMPRLWRVPFAALAYGVGCGVLYTIIYWVVLLTMALARHTRNGAPVEVGGMLSSELQVAINFGLCFGLPMGIAVGLSTAAWRTGPSPSRTRIRFRGQARNARQGTLLAILGGMAVGLVGGSVVGFANWQQVGLKVGLQHGLTFALTTFAVFTFTGTSSPRSYPPAGRRRQIWTGIGYGALVTVACASVFVILVNLHGNTAGWLLPAAVIGILLAVTAGVIFGRRAEARVRPADARIRTRKVSMAMRRAISIGVAVGVAVGAADGVTLGAGPTFAGLRPYGLLVGLSNGIATGITTAMIVTVMISRGGAFQHPVELTNRSTPLTTLALDRRNAFFQLLIAALAFGLPVMLALGSVTGFVRLSITSTIQLGMTAGIAVGLGGSAWARWLVLGRLLLPMLGRLPWDIGTFLEDAHDRGVMRQNGPLYQFRHIRLQDYLADKPPAANR